MRFALLSVLLLAASLPSRAALSVSLSPNPPGPQPLGTTVVWTATASGGSGSYQYQFSDAPSGTSAQVRQDYRPLATWSWTPTDFEGLFTVSVTAVDTITGVSQSVSASYQLTSALNSGLAAVHPTSHPLVALYSAPSCQSPNSMRVRFQQVAALTSATTNLVPCRYNPQNSSPDTTSMNFLIAGLYPSSTYQMSWETVSPAGAILHTGAKLAFTTGALPANVFFPVYTVLTPAPATDTQQPILLMDHISISTPQGTPVPTATDLSGNILWYLPYPVGYLGRTEIGGPMFVVVPNSAPTANVLREVDLAGHTLLETNLARINQQLAAYPFPSQLVNPDGGSTPAPTPTYITAFSHEARRIYAPTPAAPNGYIIALGTEEVSSTVYQGGTPSQPVDILGDKLFVLDPNLQLVWAWSSFDHDDISRPAVLGEVCYHSQLGCKPFSNSFTSANDWLHSNTIQYTGWDGDFIISQRHQDWVIKINYNNGLGDGSIVWFLGGNLANTPYQPSFSLSTLNTIGQADIGFPWFSHQHDSQFWLGGSQVNGSYVFMVFDDGNTRRAKYNPNADSRCQLYAVNETGHGANLNYNANVGSYSFGLGSAQLLTNGNKFCDSGVIGGGFSSSTYTENTETDKNANVVFNLKAGADTYRSFRMRDLYSPVNP